MGEEQPNRQQRALVAANPLAQARQISLGAAHLLHSTTPFGVDEQHTQIGMTPHVQVHIDTAVIRVQVFSPVDSLCRETRIVISALEGPALSR